MTLLGKSRPSRSGPAWEVARLYPDQGRWEESDYLALTEGLNQLVELCDGRLEVLPMPKTSHQRIVQYLSNLILAFVTPRKLGSVLFAPLRVRLWDRTFREPDVVFMLAAHANRMGEDFWEGADLVMEVLSADPQDRKRDLVTKRREYAAAGIGEYWIIDPRDRRVTVLKRRGKSYVVHAQGGEGKSVPSALLKGFEADVTAIFEAASGR
ncbi:MAG TPA: Uma2 family endonuclease [Tepidisphaeraceae bacterium]|nr:Uma2 family endonuclease [Tepidisphaeraceae bacterium]